MKENRVSLEVFNKMFIIRFLLPIAYVAGWILLTLFAFPDLTNNNFSLNENQALFLSFFLTSSLSLVFYFLVLFLLIKFKNVKLKPIFNSLLVILLVSLGFLLLELLAICKVYQLIGLGTRVFYLGFFPISIVFGFVGIGLSSQLFLKWQKSFLQGKNSHSPKKK